MATVVETEGFGQPFLFGEHYDPPCLSTQHWNREIDHLSYMEERKGPRLRDDLYVLNQGPPAHALAQFISTALIPAPRRYIG